MILIIIGFNLENLIGFVELSMTSEFAQVFAQHIYDLFENIHRKLTFYNDNYKPVADATSRHKI